MSEELDRWQALAQELGLPVEPKNTRPSVPPPPVVEPARVVAPTPEPAPVHRPVEPERSAPPPVSVRAEEPFDLPSITSLDPPHLDPIEDLPSLDRTSEGDAFQDDPGRGEPDRPRGRGGRRGQRGGRRGRGGERNEAEAQPALERAEPGNEGPPDDLSQDDRSRRRGGRGRRPERRPEPEPEEILHDDEPIETVAEDFDDGPEDNLADLNLPSWADIIGSLYRPER